MSDSSSIQMLLPGSWNSIAQEEPRIKVPRVGLQMVLEPKERVLAESIQTTSHQLNDSERQEFRNRCQLYNGVPVRNVGSGIKTPFRLTSHIIEAAGIVGPPSRIDLDEHGRTAVNDLQGMVGLTGPDVPAKRAVVAGRSMR